MRTVARVTTDAPRKWSRHVAAPVTEPGHWFSLIETIHRVDPSRSRVRAAGESARGDRPEALDPRRVHSPRGDG